MLNTQASLEAERAQAEEDNSAAHAAMDEMRESLGQQLEEVTRRAADLDRDLKSVRDERARDAERLTREAAELSSRLEDTSTRLAATAAEKKAEFDRASADKSSLEHRLDQINEALAQRDAQIAELQRDHREQVAKVESRNSGLASAVEQGNAERQAREDQYLKELEETHDEYQTRIRKMDDDHRREVESLRSSALDAKRQLKSAQLQAQRLEERLKKLDSERPAKSGEEEFDNFMRNYVGSKSTRPSRRPRPSPSSLPTPLPADGQKTDSTPAPDRTVATPIPVIPRHPIPDEPTRPVANLPIPDAAKRGASQAAPIANRRRTAAPPPPPAGQPRPGRLPTAAKPVAGSDPAAGLTGPVGLGSADVERPNEMDRTIVAPLTAAAAADKMRERTDGTRPRLDANGNPYAEGDDFLSQISSELDLDD